MGRGLDDGSRKFVFFDQSSVISHHLHQTQLRSIYAEYRVKRRMARNSNLNSRERTDLQGFVFSTDGAPGHRQESQPLTP